MVGRTDVPEPAIARLRAICRALPDAYEEPAWVGVRWRVRGRTFAHALVIEEGRPQAYARAAGTDGPACVVTFRVTGEELAALEHAGSPYFAVRWGRDVGGAALDEFDDWDQLAELLTESYCALAPEKLARMVERPDP
ncbi:MmcQ/YjbR family DNA-binding protein [Solicola gregarius]|uniref:MmcQ/YjbR family DNA-binding protein n=1 Tax=Solicola gregarius TaxID=2908642 RepID=A0AA46TK55_9ACTN|nr:MmcQ/YjbR family DNA-binding protein [Solicola gregarius]UYM06819.1 MmcQ/YjbR family DNA-binding protein [Solicola gregarius]